MVNSNNESENIKRLSTILPVAQDPLLTTWIEQTTVQSPQLTKLTSNTFILKYWWTSGVPLVQSSEAGILTQRIPISLWP